MKHLFNRYKEKTDGNVSVLFAASFLVTFIFVGAALDVTLIHKKQKKLQDLSDAAALAAIQHNGTLREKEEAYKDHINSFAEMSGDEANITTATIDITENDETIILEANVEAPFELVMLQYFHDFDSVSASTTARMGVDNVEVALVIDISTSMAGARLEEAKKSAGIFIDEVLGRVDYENRTAVSFIPFGGTVRVPEEMKYLLEPPQEVYRHILKIGSMENGTNALNLT